MLLVFLMLRPQGYTLVYVLLCDSLALDRLFVLLLSNLPDFLGSIRQSFALIQRRHQLLPQHVNLLS